MSASAQTRGTLSPSNRRFLVLDPEITSLMTTKSRYQQARNLSWISRIIPTRDFARQAKATHSPMQLVSEIVCSVLNPANVEHHHDASEVLSITFKILSVRFRHGFENKLYQTRWSPYRRSAAQVLRFRPLFFEHSFSFLKYFCVMFNWVCSIRLDH